MVFKQLEAVRESKWVLQWFEGRESVRGYQAIKGNSSDGWVMQFVWCLLEIVSLGSSGGWA